MQDTSGEWPIVFNGETYNFADLCRELTAKSYAFRSHSDMVLAKHRNIP
jgi:asparagine synthetase B (glutamine-hydrolysing)